MSWFEFKFEAQSQQELWNGWSSIFVLNTTT
jgi:hypothetical protein